MSARKDVVQVRLSVEEKAKIWELAGKAGLKPSEWIRRRALWVVPDLVVDEPRLARDVMRQMGVEKPERFLGPEEDGDYEREPFAD